MMAKGLLDVRQYFAALYADTDIEREPTSAGRQMGGHFATRFLTEDGEWMDHMAQFNSSADISPTGGQMPRLLGLAQASKLYRQMDEVARAKTGFTSGGDEIAIGTIGDASTSEGLFWETMNAAGVLQVPMLMNVWDDGYGISVPSNTKHKASISQALSGMEMEEGTNGLVIFRVKGWDYPSLIATYEAAAQRCREEHVPVLVHVEEVTQPQGHSTSGSHERYKSEERMAWAANTIALLNLASSSCSKVLPLKRSSTPSARRPRKKSVKNKRQLGPLSVPRWMPKWKRPSRPLKPSSPEHLRLPRCAKECSRVGRKCTVRCAKWPRAMPAAQHLRKQQLMRFPHVCMLRTAPATAAICTAMAQTRDGSTGSAG